jgi:catechol 2,3-dioxygenase-like lactoylglutathione lyase family enzyme
MRIVGTHHVAISTRNFARLREFYVGTLGLTVVGGFPGHDILFINAGDTPIELVGEEVGDEVSRRGWNHLAWEVEDVDETYRELSARGVHFTVPPEDFPPEAPTVRIAFFQDPDGNLLELIRPLGSRYPSTDGGVG